MHILGSMLPLRTPLKLNDKINIVEAVTIMGKIYG